MRILRSRISRSIAAVLVLLAIVWAGIFVRTSTTLPALDEARIRHWIWHEEWTALASALWDEAAFSVVYRLYDGDDYEIRAYGGDFKLEDFELTPAQVAKYDALFAASHLGALARSDTGLYFENVASADRFGRTIVAALISPRDGFSPAEQCKDQYRVEEEGHCDVTLGPDWLLRYSWHLLTAQDLAKCAGVWREYDASVNDERGTSARRVGSEEDYGRAVEELGNKEVERWATRGQEQLHDARAARDQEEVDRLLNRCAGL